MSYAILYGIDPDSLDVDYSSVNEVQRHVSAECNFCAEEDDANDILASIQGAIKDLPDLKDVAGNVEQLYGEFDTQVQNLLDMGEKYLIEALCAETEEIEDIYNRLAEALYEQVPFSILSVMSLEKYLSKEEIWFLQKRHNLFYLKSSVTDFSFRYEISANDSFYVQVKFSRLYNSTRISDAKLFVREKELSPIIEKLEQQGYNPMNLSQEDLIVLEMLDKQNIEIYNLLYNRAQQDLK